MASRTVESKSINLKDLDYPVPEHSLRLGYTLGGITLVVFGLLFLTGIIMALFYSPSLMNTRSTLTNFISSPLGMWIRSLHYWSAAGAIFLIVLHMTRTVLTASYQKNRIWNWYFGVGLLLVTLGFLFSGTVLRWDQEGYEAYLHALASIRLLGPLGEGVGTFLSGTLVLARFFVTHTVILPIIFGLLILGHLALIKINGLSDDPCHPSTREVWFSAHMRKVLGYGLAVVGLLSFLAIVYPAALLPGPYDGVELTKPPWFFLWLYGFENLFGIWALIFAPGILITGLILVPIIDRNPDSPAWLRKLIVWGYLGVLAGLLTLIIMVALTPGQSHIM